MIFHNFEYEVVRRARLQMYIKESLNMQYLTKNRGISGPANDCDLSFLAKCVKSSSHMFSSVILGDIKLKPRTSIKLQDSVDTSIRKQIQNMLQRLQQGLNESHCGCRNHNPYIIVLKSADF